MRSYNYVVDITPDFDNEQYRIRAIDFDQQSYEGRSKVYLPQYFKENFDIVNFGIEILDRKTVALYQHEERVLIKRRYESARIRLKKLLASMSQDELSTPEKIETLKKELGEFHNTSFANCATMGDILTKHLKKMFAKPKPKALIKKKKVTTK